MSVKRDCAYGLVRTASATATGTPIVFPMTDSAKITPAPKKYQRKNSITPDICGFKGAGFDVTTEFSGAEMSVYDLAYMIALFMGGYNYTLAGLIHTITPAQDSQYFYAARDLENPVSGTDNAETAVGAKIETITIDQQPDAYAQISMSAKACSFGHQAGFEPSLSLDADDAPVSWDALIDGYFKIGLNGAAVSEDTGRTGLKIEFSRVTNFGKKTLAGAQPTKLIQGERKITVTADREFDGTQATSEYQAFVNAQEFGIDVQWVVGAGSLTITVPHLTITDPYVPDTGASDDELIASIMGTAFLSGSDNIGGIVAVGGDAFWS